ncbi:MAG TPA: PTS sugar transporter subunit IIB [Thermoanaerobacterales bacterium]|nr:PTS sugar transporter subunit IIB [Thermoanaerobacterales bacterium]
MKKKKIVIACGTGIATSTVVADKIADICKQEGIKAEISQCKVTELKSYVHGADLIVSTTIIGNKYDVPIINGLSFITGIGEDETLKKIVDELKK